MAAPVMFKLTDLIGPNPVSAARPVLAAQAMELRDRFARYGGEELFAGDLVAEKPGLGLLRPELSKNAVLMFWRPLDATQPADLAIIRGAHSQLSMSRFDCLVAFVSDSGASVVYLAHDSGCLQRLDAAELIALQTPSPADPADMAAEASRAEVAP